VSYRIDAELFGLLREVDDRSWPIDGCRPAHRERERQPRAIYGHGGELPDGQEGGQQNELCSIVQSAGGTHEGSGCVGADRTRLRLSLGLQSHAERHGPHGMGLVELARLAEVAGFDGVVIGDHVVLGDRLDRYPYPPVHFSQDASWMEPLSVLSAVAAVTTRVKLTTGVLVSPLRPAVLLAKTTATVDYLSGGRLELGVGVGWQPEEFAATGADFARRGQLLTDGIGACRALWGSDPASFRSETTTFENLWCNPKPVRPGGIPVLFSGSLGARNRARIVELGNGWITHPRQPLVDTRASIESLTRSYEEYGRDPETLVVRTSLPMVRRDDDTGPDLEASFAKLDAYRDAGITDITIWSNSVIDAPEQAPDRIAALGAAWRRARLGAGTGAAR
jgi:probable F420-dependent oxidoreductase